MFTPAKILSAVVSGQTLTVETEGSGEVNVGLTKYEGGWKVVVPHSPTTRTFPNLPKGNYFVQCWNIADASATEEQQFYQGIIMTDATIKRQYGANGPRYAPWIEVK